MDAESFEGRFGYGYIINLGYPRADLPAERKIEFGAFLRAHEVMHVARGTWYVQTRVSLAELKASLAGLLREGESFFLIPIPEGGLTAFTLQASKTGAEEGLSAEERARLERYRGMSPEGRVDGRLDAAAGEGKN